MTNYQWRFAMGTRKEPTWEVFQGANDTGNHYKLLAYAKRAKDAGWFVRISGVNNVIGSQKIYIGDDVFPPDFMKTMLEMNKNADT